MSVVFLEFRASLIGKEFEIASLALPAQAQPRFLAVIRANPSHPWFKYTRLAHSSPLQTIRVECAKNDLRRVADERCVFRIPLSQHQPAIVNLAKEDHRYWLLFFATR
jgi:hypothetical protein